MNRSKSWVLGLALFLGMALVAQAADFSADVAMQTGGQTMQIKMYVSGNKSRSEMMGITTIAHLDRGVAWVMMPGQNIYMEQPINPAMAVRTSTQIPGEFERVSMGKENINGQDTEKFKISYNDAQGQTTIYQWVGKDGDFPVRIQSVDGSWTTDFNNVQTGPQNPALFEVPAGYQKMAMPMGSLGQMMQGMGDLDLNNSGE